MSIGCFPRRRGGPLSRAVVPVAVPAFQAGHFTELVRRHDWPPRFEPQMQRTRELEQSELSRINREKRVALGDHGTIVGLSAKAEAERLLRRLSAPKALG